MSRRWRVVATLVLGLVACDEARGPTASGAGGLTLQVVAAAAGGPALDSGYVLLTGPTDTTVKAVRPVPGTQVTIGGLKPGPYTVELEGFAAGGLARYGAVPGVTTVVAGQNATATLPSFPLLQLAFKVQPSSVRLGRAIAPGVQVSVVDPGGNVVTRATDSVTVSIGSNPSGCSLKGARTIAAVAGVATFSDLSIGEIGAGYTLTAGSGALTGATSTAFDVYTFVAVVNFVDTTIWVMQTSSSINSILAKIRVPQSPYPVSLAYTPDGSRLYVTSQGSNNVSVVDALTGKLVAQVPLAGTSQEVAITADGASAYVTNPFLNELSVISTATNTVGATIPLQASSTSPLGVAIRPDGQFVYTADNGSNDVAVINTVNKLQIANPGSGGTRPQSVGITPSGAFAYVTNATSNTVGVVNTATNAPVGTVSVGSGPRGIAVSPDGAFAYVANFGDSTVSVIRTSDNTLLPAPIIVGHAPSFIAFTPCGAFAYVTNTTSNTVSVIATATRQVVATIPVGSQPAGIAIPRVPCPC